VNSQETPLPLVTEVGRVSTGVLEILPVLAMLTPPVPSNAWAFAPPPQARVMKAVPKAVAMRLCLFVFIGRKGE